MTDEEIHNIYLHMTGKAEGIAEATGTADFPVLFARAILEFNRMEREAEKQEPVPMEVVLEEQQNFNCSSSSAPMVESRAEPRLSKIKAVPNIQGVERKGAIYEYLKRKHATYTSHCYGFRFEHREDWTSQFASCLGILLVEVFTSQRLKLIF